ncbi:uncharacterized protein LOC117174256 [Belonocnema kinseyi]|uniref:uncharacterized protein LOC117174256 n=1 Tax=Belonocnema kinseyi TaxID=2817044 RepID=UPI00143D3CCD|nr:uncharacterized protein LOC117174256 [Belonocnema kinseyi]
MKKVVKKCIVNYFSYLKNVDDTWNDLCKSAKEVIRALKNRCQQLRLVNSIETDKQEIFKIAGLREKLILKLIRGIQEEMTLLGNLLARLNCINQELKNKLMRLEEARSNISLKDSEIEELVSGSPVFPKLEKLLIWAQEVYDYYKTLYQNINEAMLSLDYKNEETIDRLENSFQINYYWRIKIDRVRGLTEALSKTVIPQV